MKNCVCGILLHSNKINEIDIRFRSTKTIPVYVIEPWIKSTHEISSDISRNFDEEPQNLYGENYHLKFIGTARNFRDGTIFRRYIASPYAQQTDQIEGHRRRENAATKRRYGHRHREREKEKERRKSKGDGTKQKGWAKRE